MVSVKLQRGEPSMGQFAVDVGVSRPGGGPAARVRALVDTGATHSTFPASLMSRLNVPAAETRRYSLGDGREVEYYYGMASIELNGRVLPCPVTFGAEDEYLLGATTLECFELMVDPIGYELVPRKLLTGPI